MKSTPHDSKETLNMDTFKVVTVIGKKSKFSSRNNSPKEIKRKYRKKP
jgi:hypothetical protein